MLQHVYSKGVKTLENEVDFPAKIHFRTLFYNHFIGCVF